MTDTNSEETLKAEDDALDMREDVRKRRREWHSLNGRTSLPELYVAGEVSVHVRVCVAVRLDESEVGDWCAVFEAHPLVDVQV